MLYGIIAILIVYIIWLKVEKALILIEINNILNGNVKIFEEEAKINMENTEKWYYSMGGLKLAEIIRDEFEDSISKGKPKVKQWLRKNAAKFNKNI